MRLMGAGQARRVQVDPEPWSSLTVHTASLRQAGQLFCLLSLSFLVQKMFPSHYPFPRIAMQRKGCVYPPAKEENQI